MIPSLSDLAVVVACWFILAFGLGFCGRRYAARRGGLRGWMSEGRYFAIALGVAVLVVLVGVGVFMLWPSGATMLLMIPIDLLAPVAGILVANSLDHP